VGTADKIWDGTGPVEDVWIAAGKKVAKAAVKDADVKAMHDALRGDFKAAEAARDQWVAEPK
jgi:hypothetical protein